jgi:hypothetical protein
MTTRRGKHPEHERKHEHEDEHRRRSDREEEDGGDDPGMHFRIIARRWLGSPPATAERYARALRQWQALPGAVVSPATYVTVAAETVQTAGASPTPAGSSGEESAP